MAHAASPEDRNRVAQAWSEVAELLELQSGVIGRRQVRNVGLSDHDVRRMLRRREWATVHGGVYVDHTGEPTWVQRAWAAVTAVAPAALYASSAIRACEGKGRRSHDDAGPIHVAIDRGRVVQAPPGVVLHRIAGFESKVQPNTSPPRQRIAHAVVDVAAEAGTDIDAIATLSDAVRARLTTADRMRAALDSRSRIRRRALLASVLDDIATGTCSALEHGYLDRVERAHDLPSARRQVRESAKGALYRDVAYELIGLLIELDGRLDHIAVRDRDRDLDRDLDAAVDDRETIRLGWGQVYDRPCRTASKLATVMQRLGWTGNPTRCPGCPAPENSVGSLTPGDCDPTPSQDPVAPR